MNQKSALITGAAKRIGKSIALHLAANGYGIAIHYNQSKKSALALQAELQDRYPQQKFKIFQCDLGDTNQLENFIDRVMQHFDSLTVLVNNASVFEPGRLRETSVQLLNNQLDVNLKAPFILSRDYAMNNKYGNIINLLDTRITSNNSSYAAYSLSKVALSYFTKMAALEFAPNIRVNAIALGATLAPEGMGIEYLNSLAAKTPMKITGGIEPILQSLDYILTNDNLTGQILFCDGGEQLL
ncbi:SDR family oxidoreductase [Ancylomarina longa]|nr:SDR family oxidoreductase [Ancylomarina longa]